MNLKGIGASPGIVIGEVKVKKTYEVEINREIIHDCELEIQRLNRGRDRCKQQIQKEYEYTRTLIGEKESSIFEICQMMLEDPEYFGQIKNLIRNEKVNAEWAIDRVTENFVQIFTNLKHTYISERAIDIKATGRRLIQQLHRVAIESASEINEELVIVAKDLMPSELTKIERKIGIGCITEGGSINSHTTILARALGIPLIVGATGLMKGIKTGDKVVFDGETGEIVVNPSEGEIGEYQEKKRKKNELDKCLQQLKGLKSITKDERSIEVLANIDSIEDINMMEENDAEGIGLFRTEFLCIEQGRLLGEEEQLHIYKEAVKRMNGKPTIIRTLDIGGDKELPGYVSSRESNPFLGYRGIRISLNEEEVFKTQLRAILRASKFGKMKVIFPMVSAIEELRQAKMILEEVKEELRQKNVGFDPEIEVGIMIEVPSAAIMSDQFAKEVDFFSIGTNDLLQYTVAVDRMNSEIAYLYDNYHPALLRLIKQVVESGHRQGIQVGVCGEMAGMPKLIPILIGMGVDELSMSPTSILRTRGIVRQSSQTEMEKLVEKVLLLSTGKEVETLIDENIRVN